MAFNRFQNVMGFTKQRGSCSISYENYKNDSYIEAWYLGVNSSNVSESPYVSAPLKSGELSLETYFSAGLPYEVEVICLTQYKAEVLIDPQDRIGVSNINNSVAES